MQRVPQTLVFCVAAILGDLTGSLWLVPSELIKLQMQVRWCVLALTDQQSEHFPLDIDLSLDLPACTCFELHRTKVVHVFQS